MRTMPIFLAAAVACDPASPAPPGDANVDVAAADGRASAFRLLEFSPAAFTSSAFGGEAPIVIASGECVAGVRMWYQCSGVQDSGTFCVVAVDATQPPSRTSQGCVGPAGVGAECTAGGQVRELATGAMRVVAGPRAMLSISTNVVSGPSGLDQHLLGAEVAVMSPCP